MGRKSEMPAAILSGLLRESFMEQPASLLHQSQQGQSQSVTGNQLPHPDHLHREPVAHAQNRGQVGRHTSVTVGTDGLGLISYHDATNNDLKVAHCSNLACTGATTTTLDSTGLVGEYTSVTIGKDGLGLISYHDATNSDLKVAHCSNVACTGATITTVDSVGQVGRYTSVAIGTDGLGLISYRSATGADLKAAGKRG